LATDVTRTLTTDGCGGRRRRDANLSTRRSRSPFSSGRGPPARSATAVLRTGFWFRVCSVFNRWLRILSMAGGRAASENGHRPEATEGTEPTEHAGIGKRMGSRGRSPSTTVGKRPIADYNPECEPAGRRVLETGLTRDGVGFDFVVEGLAAMRGAGVSTCLPWVSLRISTIVALHRFHQGRFSPPAGGAAISLDGQVLEIDQFAFDNQRRALHFIYATGARCPASRVASARRPGREAFERTVGLRSKPLKERAGQGPKYPRAVPQRRERNGNALIR